MIIKSKPMVIPHMLANQLLKFGKIEYKITNNHKTVHKITVINDCFSLKYLYKNQIIAITDIIGNNIEYSNI